MGQSSRRPFMAEIQMAQKSRAPLPVEPDAAAAPFPALPAHALPAHAPAADNSQVLAAIQGLNSKLDKFLTVDHQQIEQIQVEVSDIAGRIRATKLEMAALRHPLASEDTFLEASQQLAAVVKAAEAATNTIINAAEQIEDIIGEVRSQLPEGYQSSRLHDLGEVIPRIYEACNFQDLTGQRITKVVNALAFIEDRVEAMMSVWNRKEFEALPLPPTLAQTDSGLALHGPAMPTETVSQADIDALFD